jgi:YVTN family beta-propeller protein
VFVNTQDVIPSFATTYGAVHMLDATRGVQVRSADGVTPIAEFIGVDEATRRVFLAGRGGGIYIPKPGGGVVVKSVSSGAVLINRRLPRHGPGGQASAAAVDSRRGCRFVPIADEEPAANPQSGTVSVVDVATARVVTTIPIGRRRLSATVDPMTGQVLILNYNDPANPTGPNGSVSVLGATPPSGHSGGS